MRLKLAPLTLPVSGALAYDFDAWYGHTLFVSRAASQFQKHQEPPVPDA